MRRAAAILIASLAASAPTGAQVTPSPCAGPFVCAAAGPAGSEPATNGIDFVYRADTSPATLVSNLTGTVVSHAGWLADPDLSVTGEVVYERDVGGVVQILSTTRGQLSTGAGAADPAINSLGEVVWVETISGRQQLVSSTRGVLTAFGPAGPVELANPALDDSGRVVFSAHLPSAAAGESNLWQISAGGAVSQLTFFAPPRRGVRPTLAAASGELVWVIEDGCEAELVSERDGTLLASDGTCSIRAAQPDLGPGGELVAVERGADRMDRVAQIARAGASGAGICSLPGVSCAPGTCDLDVDGDVDLVDSTLLRRILAGEPLPLP